MGSPLASESDPAPLRVGYFVAYPDSLAGANRSLFEMIEHLPFGIEPIVFVPRPGSASRFLEERGIACRVIPAGTSLMSFGKAPLAWSPLKKAWVLGTESLPYSLALLRAFKRSKLDILHVNCPRAALLAAPAAKVLRLPVVGHLRGSRAISGDYWLAFELMCDRIICVCDAIQRDLSPRARAKATTVYNGTRDLLAARQRAGTRSEQLGWLAQLRGEGVLVVSCFGSVTPFKGQHHLIEAAARLKAQGLREVIFLCVGKVPDADREYEAWLQGLLRQRGLDNVTIAGWQQDPFEFYAHTDIAVLPSVEREALDIGGVVLQVRGNEGFPRTHLEAMSFGLPVIGTDIAGVREQVVHDVTGLVVPPASPEQLATALERLLRDGELRRRMGEAGRKRALECFTATRCAESTVNVYRSLRATRPQRATAAYPGRKARV